MDNTNSGADGSRGEAGKTEPVKRALLLLERNGVVFAGGGNPIPGGGHMSVAASTVKKLARDGHGALQVSPDGGLMLRATKAVSR